MTPESVTPDSVTFGSAVSPVYAGVDGGGSKTRVIAVDGAGRPLLDASFDGCDLPARGEAHVRRVLAEVRAALTACDGEGATLRVALGLPALGEARAWDEALTRLAAEAFEAGSYTLHNDVRLALEGALPEGPGVLVLCGTGSMAWAKDAAGAEGRCGGWGPLLGDEGSGFDLGQRALRAACRVEDGRGPASVLHAEVPRALGVSDIHEALALLSPEGPVPRARVAGLARAVTAAAEAGDDVAQRLIDDAARELVDLVDALCERLALASSSAGGSGAGTADVPVSTAGGLFRSASLSSAFTRELTSRGYAAPLPPRHPPAVGGVLLAGLPPAALGDAHWP